MSADIGPGDIVEALSTHPRFWNQGQRFMCTVVMPLPGRVCAMGERGDHVCPGLGLRLLGVASSKPSAYWCTGSFKPLPRAIDAEGVDREENIYA